MLLPDHQRFAVQINAFLRTFGITDLTAPAPVGNIVATLYLLRLTQGKSSSCDGLRGQVKVISLSLVQLKNFQCHAAFLFRIDLSHVWIFLKYFVQFFFSDISYVSVDRDGFLAHGAFPAAHSAEGKIFLIHQLSVEFFSFCSEEIETAVIVEHHINDPCDRVAFLIKCCHNYGVDFLADYFEILCCFHG